MTEQQIAFTRGFRDGWKKQPAYYGCHVGMRSTYDACREQYAAGHRRGAAAIQRKEQRIAAQKQEA